MFFFQQNTSTSIMVGPVITSGGVISSAMTTAASIVYHNNGLATTLSLTSVVYKTGGLYQIDLSSAAVANIGRVFINLVSNVGYNAGGPVYGGVILAANYTFLYGSSAIANVLSSVNWNSETSRLLTSAGLISSQVWAYTSRDLSTYAGLSSAVWTFTSRSLTSNLTSWGASDVWGYSTRNLTSFGVTLGADVWAVTTKAVTAIPAGYSTMIASDVWAVTTRTMTSAGTEAAAVWAYSTRNLTSGASTFTAADVWSVAARTLTSAPDVWGLAADGTLTYGQSMKAMIGVTLSNSTGGGTTAISFQNWGSTKTRISYTVTTAGNRTITTYDLT